MTNVRVDLIRKNERRSPYPALIFIAKIFPWVASAFLAILILAIPFATGFFWHYSYNEIKIIAIIALQQQLTRAKADYQELEPKLETALGELTEIKAEKEKAIVREKRLREQFADVKSRCLLLDAQLDEALSETEQARARERQLQQKLAELEKRTRVAQTTVSKADIIRLKFLEESVQQFQLNIEKEKIDIEQARVYAAANSSDPGANAWRRKKLLERETNLARMKSGLEELKSKLSTVRVELRL